MKPHQPPSHTTTLLYITSRRKPFNSVSHRVISLSLSLSSLYLCSFRRIIFRYTESIDLPIGRTMKGNDSTVLRRESSSSMSYKFWILAALLLLAFWSMFTGSVTLKWSAGNLSRLSDDFSSPNYDDLDILEVEERGKVVRHMWDVYTQSKSDRVPRFWQQAFEAAYENLVSDVPGVRDSAFSEIAKMSLLSITLDPLPVKSAGTRKSRKMAKHTEKIKEVKPPKKEKKPDTALSKTGDHKESDD